MRYIPLDRITVLEPPQLARGLKCVSLAEDVFADHFPGHPVMPGSLIQEALAQLGGVLLEATRRAQAGGDVHALLTMVDRARFRKMVRPGDRLELEAHGVRASEDGGQVRSVAMLDGEVAAEMQLGFVFVKVTNPVVIARRREILNVWLNGSAEDR